MMLTQTTQIVLTTILAFTYTVIIQPQQYNVVGLNNQWYRNTLTNTNKSVGYPAIECALL